ncbi:MAG: NAD(P)H-hydrate dehydratase [Euryarchaeota archaeon]|nr:NAD(P)H-hydrate dehydratase [Euryarchaeota archaeon]
MKLCRVKEMRDLDKEATERFGISDELLMENAGLAAYNVIRSEVGVKNKRFIIFCGPGNNGGDGLVIARKVHSMGGTVRVFLLGDREKFRGAAKKNMEIASRLPIEIKDLKKVGSLKSTIKEADVVVDAVFGTGVSGNVEGRYRDLIQMINESGKTVFSVDIPSGINGDTGEVMGVAVQAEYTITYGLPKIGTILYLGYEHCGKLYVSHISFPPSLYRKKSIKIEISQPSELPRRKKDGHKGNFGKVLFIAGAAGYYGAPYLSAMGFLKAGGGYSYLAAPRSIIPSVANKGSEIVFVPLDETKSGSIALKNKKKLLKLSEEMDMVVVGPGLSLNDETQELVRQLTGALKKPLLIDGDGITAVSKNMNLAGEREEQTILTPHLGEMSRITNLSVDKIDKNKIGILQKESQNLNSVIVLKGAHSLIGYPNKQVFVNMSGNSGMATAGSGDVLTGTIAGMAGLGLSIEEAARTGVFIHGLAGDLAAKDRGEDGITAQNIMNYLSLAVKKHRENYDAIKDAYGISTI